VELHLSDEYPHNGDLATAGCHLGHDAEYPQNGDSMVKLDRLAANRISQQWGSDGRIQCSIFVMVAEYPHVGDLLMTLLPSRTNVYPHHGDLVTALRSSIAFLYGIPTIGI
jgi:hypothetical protein